MATVSERLRAHAAWRDGGALAVAAHGARLLVLRRDSVQEVLVNELKHETQRDGPEPWTIEPALDFEPRTVLPNATGDLLAVVGDVDVVVLHLPALEARRNGHGGPRACGVIPVGQMGPLRPVVQARWHPLSETSSHLALLSTDASLRIYDVLARPSQPEQEHRLVFTPVRRRQRPSMGYGDFSDDEDNDAAVSDADEPSFARARGSGNGGRRGSLGSPWRGSPEDDEIGEQSAVAFDFGNADSAGWQPFTVYFVAATGRVFGLCPVLPAHSLVNATTLLDLMDASRAQGPDASAQDDVARLHESFTSSLRLTDTARAAQARWLGLLRCRPVSDTGLLSVLVPPTLVAATPTVQGPFVTDLNGERAATVFGATDYVACDLAVLPAEGGDVGGGSADDTDGAAAATPAALATVSRDGRTIVWTEVRPCTAAWAADSDASARDAFARPVLRLRLAADLALDDTDSTATATTAGTTSAPPRLLVQPAAPDAFLVVHASGVEAVRADPPVSATGTDPLRPQSNVVTVVDVVRAPDARTSGPSLQGVALVEAPTVRPLLVVLSSGGRPHIAQLGTVADARATTPAPPTASSGLSDPASGARGVLRMTDVAAIAALPDVPEMILPEAADSDAALLQALFKLVEQHTRTYVQPALRAAAQLQNTADLLGAEGEKQSRHARELERLLTDCEDRNTQSLQPRIEHARRVQERLAQKAELFLQILMDAHRPEITPAERKYHAELKAKEREVKVAAQRLEQIKAAVSAVEAKRGADASAQAQLRLTAQQERDVRAIVEQDLHKLSAAVDQIKALQASVALL